MATPDYTVNYEDERFQQVKSEENAALNDLKQTYGGMVEQTDKFYQDQINASQQWADKQTEIQNQQTDFAIEQIEQQKEQSRKDYLKEQSGAYVDWQKQSNQYGANAENMAAQGLQNTGFSETSQVSMYNAYQNRVATAREVFANATLNYDNAIKDARLQNSAALAEIAFQAYQQQLELSLQGFQYKNSLISELTDKKLVTKQMYQDQWQKVLDQINTENALAEEVRQFNQNYEFQMQQFNEEIRQFNEEIARLKAKDTAEAEQAAAELELKKEQLEEEQRQFDEQMSYQKSKSSGDSGSDSGSGTIKKPEGEQNSDLVVVNSPYSAEGAAKKVASGELIVTKQEGNRVWVAQNPNYVKGQDKLDSYGRFAALTRPWLK